MIFASARLSSISMMWSWDSVSLIRDNLWNRGWIPGNGRRGRARTRRGRGPSNPDEERGTASRLALHPYPPSVGLDDLTADGEAGARPLEFFLGMQTPEELEDRRVELGIDTDPVVLDGDERPLRRAGASAGTDLV